MNNQSIDICVIKSNKFNTNNLPKKDSNNFNNIPDEPYYKNDYEKKINYADINKFKELTKDFIEIINVNFNDLMYKIEDILNSKLEFMNVTEDIYENRKYLYQMCFKDIYHDLEDENNVNHIASEFTNENKALFGNVIILKQIIPENNFTTGFSNITYEDIYYLLISENIHAGIIIHDNSKITQIYYNNKLKLVNMDKNNTINNLEINIIHDKNYNGYKESKLKFDFNFYVRNPKTFEKGDINLNAAASKLLNMKIEGHSIILCRDLESNKYYDLFLEDISDLLKLNDEQKKLIKDDYEEDRDKDKLKVFKSRYRILYNRLN